MAKLGLLLLVVFVLVQLSLAASSGSRVARDAETPPATEDPLKQLGALFDEAKKRVGDVFTKENVDKVMGTLNQFGDTVRQAGSDLADRISKSAESATST